MQVYCRENYSVSNKKALRYDAEATYSTKYLEV